MNPNILSFLSEFVQRLRTKSPAFFRILQLIVGCLTGLSYLPTILCNWFGVDLAPHFVTMCNDIAKYSTGLLAGLFLPAETAPVAIMNDGDLLKKTDEKRLPFTAQCEDKIDREKLKHVPKVAEVIDIKADEASFQDNGKHDEKE